MVLLSAFADDGQDGHPRHLRVGEGLIGQCAVEKRRMLISDLPTHTVPIRSGLFQAIPKNVIVLPVLFEDQVKAVIELASLNAFTASHLALLEQLTASIGIVLNSIEATMQTEVTWERI
jgi:GAF domain-containing protein